MTQPLCGTCSKPIHFRGGWWWHVNDDDETHFVFVQPVTSAPVTVSPVADERGRTPELEENEQRFLWGDR